MTALSELMTANAQADALEERMARELDEMVVKSVLYQSGDIDPALPRAQSASSGRTFLMREDPRLQKIPQTPTLIDFFRYRFGPSAHLLQSAKLAPTPVSRKRRCSPACSTTSPSSA